MTMELSKTEKALRLIAKEGITAKEAAERVGISTAAVSKAKLHPSIKRQMTQTIEQLTARVRELEEFKANVVKECASIIKHAHQDIAKQLAASQLHAEQLREALESCYEKMKQMCLNGEWYAPDKAIDLAYAALALPHDTSALDAYVSEKVKEASTQLLEKLEQLTRQRDLAVEALDAIAGRRIFIDNLASNVDIAVMTLDAIKESEAMAQGEKK